jgi:PAS domain S-box-containing protein
VEEVHRKRILLFDQDAISSQRAAAVMNQLGYHVLSAQHSVEAVEIARRDPAIALAVFELRPGSDQDGAQAAREILQFRRLPVLFLTAEGGPEAASKIRGITSNGCVLKDNLEAALQPSIEMALDLFAAHTQCCGDAILYRMIADYTFDWEYWRDSDWIIRYVSPAFERITGYPVDVLLGSGDFLLSIVHPDDRPAFIAHEEQIRAGRVEEHSLEFRILMRSGDVRWISHECQPVDSPDGRFQGTRVSNRDITEKKLAHQALVESEFFFRSLVEKAPIGIYRTDLSGDCEYTNERWRQMAGLTPEEAKGQGWIQGLHPDDRLTIGQNWYRSLESGGKWGYDYRFQDRDGKVTWARGTAARILDSNGKTTGFVGINQDITEMRLVQAALREAEENYRALFQSSEDGILMMKPGGTILTANPAACQMLGWTEEELVQSGQAAFLDETDDAIQAALEKLARDGKFPGEFTFRRKGGSPLPVEVTGALFTTSLGEVRSYLTFRDTTLRKQSEAGLQKLLAEKELLLKEVHHRVKNNLFTIASLLSIQADAMDGTAASQVLQEASGRVYSMMGIYNLLHDSSDYKNIDLKDYLETLLDEIGSTWEGVSQNVVLVTEIEPIVIGIKNSYPLGVIINEWVTNAYKHAFTGRSGGRIHVRVHLLDPGQVEVIVSDDGVGLPEGIDLENPQSFGLKLVKLLVEQMNGQLTIRRSGRNSAPDADARSGYRAAGGIEYRLVFNG